MILKQVMNIKILFTSRLSLVRFHDALRVNISLCMYFTANGDYELARHNPTKNVPECCKDINAATLKSKPCQDS